MPLIWTHKYTIVVMCLNVSSDRSSWNLGEWRKKTVEIYLVKIYFEWANCWDLIDNLDRWDIEHMNF